MVSQFAAEWRRLHAELAQKIADGEDYPMPATIDDPVILDEIAVALQTIGYPKS